MLLITNISAQGVTDNTQKKNSEEISLKQRIGIRTNAVDWLLTIPNISVEFDLGNTIRSKRTLSAGLKYNWGTTHKISPPTVFNLFDARVEWRQYFRTRSRGAVTSNPNIYTRLKERVFTTKRKSPRLDRAYYWGIYAHSSSYSFKFGKEGRQGNAYGAGLSLGYTKPLYGYDKGYIDFELGGSIGLIYHSYDVITHDKESNIYAFDPAKSKSGQLLKFPMITDIRVAFVWRFMSVSDKYKPSAERRIDRIIDKRNRANEKINKMRFRIDSIASAVRKQGGTSPDSLLNKKELQMWKQMQKEREEAKEKADEEELRRTAAAALGITLSDTLTSKQEKAIREEVKKRQKQAEEALKPKKEKKKKKDEEAEEEKADKSEKKKKKKEKKSKKDKKIEAEPSEDKEEKEDKEKAVEPEKKEEEES